MDRKPEHLVEDPFLRANFIEQQSWDEWALENAPFFLHPSAKDMVEAELKAQGIDATYEDAIAVALAEWKSTLLKETNVTEVLYLQGLTHEQRQHTIEQQHAELLRRAVELGLVEERGSDRAFREEFGD